MSSGPLNVLTFHGLDTPGRALPDGELDVWLPRRDFCAVLDLVKGRQDVVITFDDGNRSDIDVALPALLDRGLRGVFFPTAGSLDRPGYLRAADVRTLVDEGMEIGTHGMSHRSWCGMSADEAAEELVDATELLAEAAGRAIELAACPYGAYDRTALGRLRRAGFVHVMTSDGGPTSRDAWLQPRNTLRRSHDLPAVLHRLLHERPSAWQRLVRSARLTAKRWR
jgi:peptidoglycan/xylan/chitin deacetylase (PgdA/CDA1 family)